MQIKCWLKGKTPYNTKVMEILNTTVGRHLVSLFPENIAFHIATFLKEDKKQREDEKFYQTLLTATRKGKRMKFPRYCKHLRYDACGVYSYSTEVIELNWAWNSKTIRTMVHNNQQAYELCNKYA